MKKTDLAMIVFIASFSMLIAYFIGNSIFGGLTAKGNDTVKTIDSINTTVQEPDPAVFNTNAINPSIEVQIVGSDTSENSVVPGATSDPGVQ